MTSHKKAYRYRLLAAQEKMLADQEGMFSPLGAGIVAYEIYRNNRSLGMVDPTLAMARATCENFVRRLREDKPLTYEAVELAPGSPTRPGLPKRKDARVAHTAVYRP